MNQPTISHALPVEFDLLVTSVRQFVLPDSKPKAIINSDSAIDWQQLESLALYHDLIPLLHWYLGKCDGIAHMPTMVQEQFNSLVKKRHSHSLFLTVELVRLIKLLAGAGIEAIPYKGPLLAEQLYGDTTLRHSTDLDILVPKEKLLQAVKVMVSAGYIESRPLPQDALPQFLNREYNYKLEKFTPERYLVELHWAFGIQPRAPYIDPVKVAARARKVSFPPIMTKAIHPVDLLLLLTSHLGFHASAGTVKLKWLADIALLSRQLNDDDWHEAFSNSKAIGSYRLLLTSLILVRDVIGIPLPGVVEVHIARNQQAKSMADYFRTVCFPTSAPLPGVEHILSYFRLRERLRDKLSVGLSHLEPKRRDKRLAKLGRFGLLLRPFQMVTDHAGALLSAYKPRR